MFNQKISRWAVLGGALLITFFIVTPESYALDTNNFFDRMVRLYANGTQGWEATLQRYALSLFWILAGLEFTWSAIKLALKGADLSEFLAELFNRILYIGFFFTLLTHSAQWSHAIVDSFRQAGATASSSAGGANGLAPSNIFDTGMQILQRITSSMSIYDPGDSIILALAAIVILIGFALITALLVIALVESYCVISAGVILMGFGGSHWTNEFAINTLRYAVSVGAKLFMVQLIVGLGQQILNEWSMQAQTGTWDLDDALTIAAASIVFLAITKVIPEMVQGLINGSSLSTGSPITALAAGTAGAIGAAAGMATGGAMSGLGMGAGAVAAGRGAMDLASEQMKDSGDQPASKGARFAALTGMAAKETGSQLMQNLGQRFRGEIRHGSMGGQMGHEMHQKAERLREFRDAQKEESSSPNAGSSQGKRASGNRIYPQED